MLDQYGLAPDDYEVLEDGTRVVRDGRALRVPLFLKDAAHHDASRAALEKAYRQREWEDCNAWRSEFQDALKRRTRGTAWDPDGRVTSTWQEEHEDELNDALALKDAVLNPHSPRFDLARARAMRDAAFERHDREQEQAWMRGK